MTKRRNGECSIFPYRGSYAAYAWATTPDGESKRKWVYGKTHEEVHGKWIKLQNRARQGPMPTTTPTLSGYLAYWLREVVGPNLAPKTTERYQLFTRLYIVPGLGGKRLDRLQVRDVRTWLNRLRTECQCCAQGKDAARPPERRRCCAIGQCCEQTLSSRTIKDVRDTLRSALGTAMAEELVTRNVAGVVRLPVPKCDRPVLRANVVEPDHQGRTGHTAVGAGHRHGGGTGDPQRGRCRAPACAKETQERVVVGGGGAPVPRVGQARQ